MIVLFTDFGVAGPYLGQMKAVLYRDAPGVPVVDLFADVPSHNVRAGAYLLPAYVEEFPQGTVLLCVVDPGVGTGNREPIALKLDGRWFVGPGNGLFALVAARAKQAKAWRITWRPAQLSASFHGRDLFAPVAARLARGEPVPGEPVQVDRGKDWPADLCEVIYIDHFGNAMTGQRANAVPRGMTLEVGGWLLLYAHTFGEVPDGEAFWYQNANGLVEIAVNRGRAADQLQLKPGTPVRFVNGVMGTTNTF